MECRKIIICLMITFGGVFLLHSVIQVNYTKLYQSGSDSSATTDSYGKANEDAAKVAGGTPAPQPTWTDTMGAAKFQEIKDLDVQRVIFKGQAKNRRAIFDNPGPRGVKTVRYALEPEVACATKVRVGAVVDGGKWVCNPWRISSPCTVYSFGVGGDVSFEQELLHVVNKRCQIFTFDPNNKYASTFSSMPNVKFHPWKITAKTNEAKQEYSLADVMKKFGHDSMEILKIDSEGSEYSILPAFFAASTIAPCQILIEMHGSNAKSWSQLLEFLGKKGYSIFNIEPNEWCGTCVEYGLIHKDCLAKYHVPKPFQSNFNLDFPQ